MRVLEVVVHVPLVEERGAKAAEDPLAGDNLLPEAHVVHTCPLTAHLTGLERFAVICMPLVTPLATRRAHHALIPVGIQQLLRSKGPGAVGAAML